MWFFKKGKHRQSPSERKAVKKIIRTVNNWEFCKICKEWYDPKKNIKHNH